MRIIPLFGYGVTGKSQLVTSQRRVNVLYEIKTDGDKQKIVIYGTPGTNIFADISIANGPVRGMHNFISLSLMFVIVGNILYEVNNAGNFTNRGSITPGSNFVAMEDNSKQLIIVDGTQGWIYTPATTTLAKITDPNFNQSATSVCFDSGYFFVDNNPANTGQFNKSASYDGTTWSSTDFGIFSSSSNQLIRVYSFGGLIILFGSLNLEFWQNVGGSGFPYTYYKGAASPYGLAARWSVAPVENTIVFLGQNQQGQVSIFMLQGFEPVRISNQDIDSILATFTVVSDAVAMGYVSDGHIVYQITFPNAKRSFIYDNTSNEWGEVQTGVGETGRHLANLGIGFNGEFYCGDATIGKIYQFSTKTYTDNGATIPRVLQTRHIFQDNNIIGIDELVLDMETGVGLQSGQGSNPQIMLQVSKDNGRTWGNERWVSFGKVGQYRDHRAVWRRFGSGRDFVFRFVMTDPVKFTVVDGSIQVRVGTDNESNNPRS